MLSPKDRGPIDQWCHSQQPGISPTRAKVFVLFVACLLQGSAHCACIKM